MINILLFEELADIEYIIYANIQHTFSFTNFFIILSLIIMRHFLLAVIAATELIRYN